MGRFYCRTENKIADSVFTRSHAEFLPSFSIDQSLSKLVRVTGTFENLNLAVNLIFFSSKIRRGGDFFFCTAIKTSHWPKL
jgi:hypothetical protein